MLDNPGAPAFVLACLGCKVNQAEAAWLADQLVARGWRRAGPGEPAALCLLMTCSVTTAAARQSRQMARRLLKAHPGARAVASGCDVQAAPASYAKAGLAVLARAELAGLPGMASGDSPWPGGAGPASLPPPDAGPLCPGVRPPGAGRSRGLLKVQDGCDAACAYCIVPALRGRPRSLPLEQAVQAWREMGRAGAAEVVLTGVHLGRWGSDLLPPAHLTDLIDTLLAAHPGPLLRLSSLEVSEVGDGLLERMAADPRLCPHLHVPLQTGGDRLLEAMGRPYTALQYARRVRAAQAAVPGLCLGADVMVGLPGESEADFLATHDLVAGLPLAYLHVFPYSPRPGTPAAAMPERTPAPVAKARAARLRALGRAKRLAFHQAQAGRRLTAVMEGAGLARTGNYCLVRLAAAPPAGSRVEVEITGLEETPEGPLLLGRRL